MQMFEKKVRKRISRLGRHRRYYINFASFWCMCRQVEGAERAALMGKVTNWSKTLFSTTREAASWKSKEITSSLDENTIVLLIWTAFSAMTELNLVTPNGTHFSPQIITNL